MYVYFLYCPPFWFRIIPSCSHFPVHCCCSGVSRPVFVPLHCRYLLPEITWVACLLSSLGSLPRVALAPLEESRRCEYPLSPTVISGSLRSGPEVVLLLTSSLVIYPLTAASTQVAVSDPRPLQLSSVRRRQQRSSIAGLSVADPDRAPLETAGGPILVLLGATSGHVLEHLCCDPRVLGLFRLGSTHRTGIGVDGKLRTGAHSSLWKFSDEGEICPPGAVSLGWELESWVVHHGFLEGRPPCLLSPFSIQIIVSPSTLGNQKVFVFGLLCYTPFFSITSLLSILKHVDPSVLQ